MTQIIYLTYQKLEDEITQCVQSRSVNKGHVDFLKSSLQMITTQMKMLESQKADLRKCEKNLSLESLL